MSEVQQLVDMGFNEADARRVLQQVAGNVEQAVERLLSGVVGDDPPPRLPARIDGGGDTGQDPLRGQTLGGTDANPIPVSLPAYEDRDGTQLGSHAEDQDLSTALEMSMRDQRGERSRADGSAFIGGMPVGASVPGANLAAEAASRDRDLPCGLRNIGNTCYVNSFLQTLLHIDEFRERILRYRIPAEQTPQAPVRNAQEPEAEQALGTEAANASRREHCIRLAGELRHLFAYGLFTMRTCIDPTRLLGELVDERGQKLPIGSQEDVGEFMLKFLERLDEGLRAGVFMDSEEHPAEASKDEVAADSAAGEAPREPEPSSAPSATGSKTQESAAAAPEKGGPPSPLQSLFFGQQVQVFSYREGVAADARQADGADAGAGEAFPPALAAPGAAEAAEGGAEDGRSPGGSSPGAPAAGSSSEPGKLIVSEEKGEFLQIFLDVKHKDLYSAWEAANCTQVEYTTPSGASTEASTNIWIERLPKLLSFQLQRVVFDHEKKVQVKLDESFEFDLTLHVDRFRTQNREAAQAAAVRVRELRERREELSKALSRFQEYQGRPGLGVSDVLGLAAECLGENVSEAAAAAAGAAGGVPRLELCDPHSLAAAAVPEATAALNGIHAAAPQAVQILRSLRESCLAQEAVLTAEIERLTQEVTDSHKDLRQCPYELHAIWVHQGIAGSGHYWAYVRDWRSDRWIRYDDALVSVVAWEDVRTAAVGQAGSNTSAYVLVYVAKDLAVQQSQGPDLPEVLKAAEACLPQKLLGEISLDNGRLAEEREEQAERAAEQELRQHAEAIFQHYAGLIHKWEPQKRTGDRSGNPHDPNMRKFLHDSALLSFQLFLYRLHGEQEVWTHYLMESIEAQKKIRHWSDDDEGRILYFLANTLRSQKCFASMLRDKPAAGRNQPSRCEIQALDMPKLYAQYTVVLVQAHIIDEALQSLKDDGTRLVQAIGSLAYVWARWNLEAEDKFRQNEVLLIMSTLIYNTITILTKHRDSKVLAESVLATFQPACEYFLLLLFAVEWPNSWKQPLITRIQNLFPSTTKQHDRAVVQKDIILQHPLTQAQERLEPYEHNRPEPGQEFFNRHRNLYSWLMSADESIARDYVVSMAPSLREQGAVPA